MTKTTAFEKLSASIINVFTAMVMAYPLYLIVRPDFFQARLILIWMFLVHNLIPLFFRERRDIGMMLMKTYWEKRYHRSQLVLYSIFYTASFATLLFWIWVPFDLFLANMLLLQLPCVLLTGTTLHGYISGGVCSVKKA